MADRVEAMSKLSVPTSISSLRSVLGASNFYRQAIPAFSAAVVAPLNYLLKKGVAFVWRTEQQEAFDEMKRLLTEAPVLAHPKWDRGFILTTNYSNKGIAAVLSQIDDDGKERPIAYHSRSCNDAQSRHSSVEGEALACLWGFKTFHYFLYGNAHQTILYTDASAVSWILTSKNLSGKLQRTAAALMGYNFEVRHRHGVLNTVADCLSRYLLPTYEDTTTARSYFGAFHPPDVHRPVPITAYTSSHATAWDAVGIGSEPGDDDAQAYQVAAFTEYLARQHEVGECGDTSCPTTSLKTVRRVLSVTFLPPILPLLYKLQCTSPVLRVRLWHTCMAAPVWLLLPPL